MIITKGKNLTTTVCKERKWQETMINERIPATRRRRKTRRLNKETKRRITAGTLSNKNYKRFVLSPAKFKSLSLFSVRFKILARRICILCIKSISSELSVELCTEGLVNSWVSSSFTTLCSEKLKSVLSWLSRTKGEARSNAEEMP